LKPLVSLSSLTPTFLHVEPRKTAWYGNEGCNYVYSRIARRAIPWTNELAEIKELVEKESHATFNSCLCNRYDDGNMYMNWHADDEDVSQSKRRSGVAASPQLLYMIFIIFVFEVQTLFPSLSNYVKTVAQGSANFPSAPINQR
jgi:hypothetical protein